VAEKLRVAENEPVFEKLLVPEKEAVFEKLFVAEKAAVYERLLVPEKEAVFEKLFVAEKEAVFEKLFVAETAALFVKGFVAENLPVPANVCVAVNLCVLRIRPVEVKPFEALNLPVAEKAPVGFGVAGGRHAFSLVSATLLHPFVSHVSLWLLLKIRQLIELDSIDSSSCPLLVDGPEKIAR
jgi:hypothetical protein